MAVVPDSSLGQGGGSGIDMLSTAPGTSIDAGALATDVNLTDGLPAGLLPPTGGAEGTEEQPRRPTTPGGRRRVDDQAVQKSKQDMQNCFGFDVSIGTPAPVSRAVKKFFFVLLVCSVFATFSTLIPCYMYQTQHDRQAKLQIQ